MGVLTYYFFVKTCVVGNYITFPFRMIPYGCLSTGKDVGVIEIVKNAKTITAIQSQGGALSSIQIDSSQLHKWIRDLNPDRLVCSSDQFYAL